jgi:acetyl esterase/lipase
MPPAGIIDANIDPLESDEKLLADKPREPGVEVSGYVQTGVTHGFFDMDALLDDGSWPQRFGLEPCGDAPLASL